MHPLMHKSSTSPLQDIKKSNHAGTVTVMESIDSAVGQTSPAKSHLPLQVNMPGKVLASYIS